MGRADGGAAGVTRAGGRSRSGPLAGGIQLDRLRRQMLAVMGGGLPVWERAEAGRSPVQSRRPLPAG